MFMSREYALVTDYQVVHDDVHQYIIHRWVWSVGRKGDPRMSPYCSQKKFCAVCFVDNELVLLFNCAILAVFLSISKVSLQKSVFEFMHVSVCYYSLTHLCFTGCNWAFLFLHDIYKKYIPKVQQLVSTKLSRYKYADWLKGWEKVNKLLENEPRLLTWATSALTTELALATALTTCLFVLPLITSLHT